MPEALIDSLALPLPGKLRSNTLFFFKAFMISDADAAGILHLL